MTGARNWASSPRSIRRCQLGRLGNNKSNTVSSRYESRKQPDELVTTLFVYFGAVWNAGLVAVLNLLIKNVIQINEEDVSDVRTIRGEK